MPGVQFNLLPSVKLDYIKTIQTRKRVTRIAVIVSGASVALLLVMLLTVQGVQRKQLSDSEGKIASTLNDIKGEQDITKVLTVQNQLVTLSELHANKHVTSRAFDYLTKLTPTGASLTRLSVDYSKNNIIVDGTADSANSVNKFIDTIKFTKYSLGTGGDQITAFSSVVASNFNISTASVSYSLSVTFDPVLFGNNNKDKDGNLVAPTLIVPNQTTTRSAIFSGGQ